MAEKRFCNEPCIQEVSKELGLSFQEVRDIVATQFEFAKVVMESNTFDSVRFPYLGVLKSKPKEVQILNYLRGMTPEQQVDFKRLVRSGKFKIQYD